MKKFVTLSAVALAGATMGVGSTFGWWAEEAPATKEKVLLPVDSATVAPVLTESVPTLAPLEVPIAPVPNHLDVSGPDDFPGVLNPPPAPIPPKGAYRTQPATQAIVPSSDGILRDDADRLTRELLKEAEELEKKGQTEAAKIHRKLISRLQRTPRRQLPEATVTHHVTVMPAMRDFAPAYISADGPFRDGAVSQLPNIEYRMVTKLDDLAVNLAQRAANLEDEARLLDEQGQKEFAEEKRKLASELKKIEKQFPPVNVPVKVTTRTGQPLLATGKVADSGKASAISPHPTLKLRTMNIASTSAVLERTAKDFEEEAMQLEKQGEKQAAEKKRDLAKAIRIRAKEMGRQATWFTGDVPVSGLNISEPQLNSDELQTRKIGRDQKDQKGASISIPRGMRVVSLPADTTQAVGETIRAGDHVDIYLTSRVAAGANQEPETKAILRSARVFATGMQQVAVSHKGRLETKHVSLVLPADDARMLLEVLGEGRFHLALAIDDVPFGVENQGVLLVPKDVGSSEEGQKKEPQPFLERRPKDRADQRVNLERGLVVDGPIKLDGLQEKLAKLFPNSTINLFSIPGEVRIKLEARDSEEAAWILQIVRGEIMNQRPHMTPDVGFGYKGVGSPAGPHAEIRKMLKELHHEITELRSEVRDLRNVISEESRNEKRDTDAKPIGDDVKRPAEASEDKPQVDD